MQHGSVLGGSASRPIAALIARPLQRPCLPRAEDGRDTHSPPHSLATVGLHLQARTLARQPRRSYTSTRPGSLPHRSGVPFVASARARRHAAVRCSANRHCRHRPLKLTLPIVIAGSAVQANTFYPTPCTTVLSISVSSASDKRYSLDRKQ